MRKRTSQIIYAYVEVLVHNSFYDASYMEVRFKRRLDPNQKHISNPCKRSQTMCRWHGGVSMCVSCVCLKPYLDSILSVGIHGLYGMSLGHKWIIVGDARSGFHGCRAVSSSAYMDNMEYDRDFV